MKLPPLTALAGVFLMMAHTGTGRIIDFGADQAGVVTQDTQKTQDAGAQQPTPKPMLQPTTIGLINHPPIITFSAMDRVQAEATPPAQLPAASASERRIECMTQSAAEDWDQDLQIAGVLIIFGASGLGVLFPVACRYLRFLRINEKIMTTGRMFGAGVILATAFVHMLGGSVESLKDECVQDRLGDFDSWPGFLAMLSILAMHLIETLLMRQAVRRESNRDSAKTERPRISLTEGMMSEREQIESDGSPHTTTTSSSAGSPHTTRPRHSHGAVFGADRVRRNVSTYILELGVALHSVIIGMTMAVTGGPEFKTLLIAISLHQFFEGFALGSRIAVLVFPRFQVILILLNALGFALTTPAGQVVGILIRQSFAPRSPTTLLVMGVLDGLSAGVLIYSAVVNLLVEEFSPANNFHRISSRLAVFYIVVMYAGCAAMSVIGKWA